MPTNVINKVIYDGRTLLDVSQDTATQDKVLEGYTFHDANGAQVEGTCTYDADTSDATAQVAEVLTGKTYYKAGSKLTGTMPSRGAVTLEIDDKNDELTIAQGYHDGSGKAKIAAAEKAKLIPDNIKEGVTILGIVGSHSGSEDVKAVAGTATPTSAQQVISPQQFGDYNYLTQVTVAAVPYVETATPGTTGYTATIL